MQPPARSCKKLSGHADAVLSLVFSRDGAKLLSGSYDGTARLWDIAAGTSKEFRGHDWWVWSVTFSPDEQRFVTGSQDGSAIVWDIATGQPSAPFLGHGGPVYSAAFAPERRIRRHRQLRQARAALAARRSQGPESRQGSEPGLNGTDTGPANAVHRTQRPHGWRAQRAVFQRRQAPRFLRLRQRDLRLGHGGSQAPENAHGHASRVSSAPVHARRRLRPFRRLRPLCQAVEHLEVRRSKVARGSRAQRPPRFGARPAFSPDGRMVVTASRDRSAAAWDVEAVKCFVRIAKAIRTSHLPPCFCRTASACSLRPSITPSAFGTWPPARSSYTLEGTGTSAAVAVSHDGQWIVTGSDDKRLRIWEH